MHHYINKTYYIEIILNNWLFVREYIELISKPDQFTIIKYSNRPSIIPISTNLPDEGNNSRKVKHMTLYSAVRVGEVLKRQRAAVERETLVRAFCLLALPSVLRRAGCYCTRGWFVFDNLLF